jgi:hypothetical protein
MGEDEHHFTWGKLAIIILVGVSAIFLIIIVMRNLNRIFGQ